MVETISMDQQYRESVFYLLYAMALIDNRVVKVEVDLFFAIVENFLRKINYVDTLTAKAIISSWFIQNYKIVMQDMKSSLKESHLLGYVDNLKNYEHRNEVYTMMKKIAMVDNEFHEDERVLLEKVSEIWGLEL